MWLTTIHGQHDRRRYASRTQTRFRCYRSPPLAPHRRAPRAPRREQGRLPREPVVNQAEHGDEEGVTIHKATTAATLASLDNPQCPEIVNR